MRNTVFAGRGCIRSLHTFLWWPACPFALQFEHFPGEVWEQVADAMASAAVQALETGRLELTPRIVCELVHQASGHLCTSLPGGLIYPVSISPFWLPFSSLLWCSTRADCFTLVSRTSFLFLGAVQEPLLDAITPDGAPQSPLSPVLLCLLLQHATSHTHLHHIIQ